MVEFIVQEKCMAPSKKERQHKQVNEIIPQRYQHTVSMLVLFLSILIFFHEIVFDGKTFVTADNIASKSFQTLISDANDQGIPVLWNPYIFCGMPGIASMMVGGERLFDISAIMLNWAKDFFGIVTNSPELGWELLFYFLFGAGIYFLVWDKVKNKIAALISGLAVMHSSYLVSLITVGHMTKIPVIAFFPWMLLILNKLHEKFSILWSLLIILLIHYFLMPGHVQMIYYMYLAWGIYYLFFIIRGVAKKENIKGYLRSGVILAVGSVIALAMTGDKYLPTLEYSTYSMRGSSPIMPSPQAQEKGGSGGLDYDYATQWSYSPGETFTFIIPSLYGFGDTKYQGVLSRNQEISINTYFGPLNFTDAPQYMGIIILFLAVVGFWRNKKDPFVQYAAIVIVFSLFVSFGRNLPILFDPMFYYFPLFNRFRIPVMILVLVQIMVPILAGYGCVEMFKGVKDAKEKKYWMYAVGSTAAIFFLSLIAKGFFISIYQSFFSQNPYLQRYNSTVATELFNFVSNNVAVDITVASVLLTAVIGGYYLYWNKKLTLNVLSAGLVICVLFDLWRVNFQFMDPQPHKSTTDYFEKPDYVQYLLSDTTHYRTLQFEKGQPPYDNTLAYWKIQSAYGYSGTKMREIQDVFDVCGVANPLEWGLMNVKYIISDRMDTNQVLQIAFHGSKNVLYNRASLPRAFFVNKLEIASGLEILNNIKKMNFNPLQVGYMMDDPKVTIDPPDSGTYAQYIHYGINDLALKVKASGNNLLFLSEAWYPKGWKAFIDGTEVPIYRLNYMFRGVIVPPGEHTLSMKMESSSYTLGKNLSLLLNIITLGGFGFFGVWEIYRKGKFKK